MHAFKWILPYIKPYRFRMVFGFALNIIVTLTFLINPYMTGRIIANVLEGGQKELLLTYLGIMLGTTFGRSVLRYIQLLLFESASQGVCLALRRDLYDRVLRQTFSFYDQNRVGDIMSRMTGDLEAVRSFIGYDSYGIPENILLFLSALVMMFVLSVPMALCMLVVVPLVLFTAIKQGKEIKPAFRNVREQFSNLNSKCEENIGGNRVVKAFAKEKYEIEKFTAANQEFYNANTNTARIWAKYSPLMETYAGALPLISLLLGSLLIIWGKMELWQMITFNGYLWMVNMPTRMFGMFVNNIQNVATSIDKVYGMMRQHIHIYDPDEPVVPPEKPLEGRVEFNNVYFGYDRNEPGLFVLKDISFQAEAGQTIGIVGPTGSGKTSLSQLIGRFYDVTKGNVLADGVNVKEYPLNTLRKGITSAMQDVFLFSDTIEGNIAYGSPDISMETVYASARAADADDFIRHMPDGYDTIVGERGVGLSGGQKQRLSLARALAAEPAILILDDTTSAVDMETEKRIQTALAELQRQKKRTTFVIAHRLLSVKEADLILVLENGSITERGTHAELMALEGYYARLFREQQGLSEANGMGEDHGA